VDVWITIAGLRYSLFPVFICKDFLLNSLATNMKQTCHSACCVLLVIDLIYLLIKYSVNLANIDFTYVR
jgi:hypothetical protein